MTGGVSCAENCKSRAYWCTLYHDVILEVDHIVNWIVHCSCIQSSIPWSGMGWHRFCSIPHWKATCGVLHSFRLVLLTSPELRCVWARTESIAFYNGEKHEERCASLRLVLLVAVVRIKIIWATFLALWTNFYQHATLLLPSLLTAPRYFAGEVEFGVITQVPLGFCASLSARIYACDVSASAGTQWPLRPRGRSHHAHEPREDDLEEDQTPGGDVGPILVHGHRSLSMILKISRCASAAGQLCFWAH